MMGWRIKLAGGHEWDYFSRKARRIVGFNAGVGRYLKRQVHKRSRRQAALEITEREGQ